MSRRTPWVLCGLLCWVSMANAQTTEDDIRALEQAFADTMAQRDFEAFQSFLAEDATFTAGGKPMQGKAAIAENWRPYFAATQAPFSWAPDLVLLRDNGQLALSSGPVMRPDGTRSATFTSVWERQPDGQWRIVFDKGERWCAPPPAEPD